MDLTETFMDIHGCSRKEAETAINAFLADNALTLSGMIPPVGKISPVEKRDSFPYRHFTSKRAAFGYELYCNFNTAVFGSKEVFIRSLPYLKDNDMMRVTFKGREIYCTVASLVQACEEFHSSHLLDITLVARS